jgi:hypothetical protein
MNWISSRSRRARPRDLLRNSEFQEYLTSPLFQTLSALLEREEQKREKCRNLFDCFPQVFDKHGGHLVGAASRRIDLAHVHELLPNATQLGQRDFARQHQLGNSKYVNMERLDGEALESIEQSTFSAVCGNAMNPPRSTFGCADMMAFSTSCVTPSSSNRKFVSASSCGVVERLAFIAFPCNIACKALKMSFNNMVMIETGESVHR